MQRRDDEEYQDPEADLHWQLQQQAQAEVPAPTPDPVYDQPEGPSGNVQPFTEQNPWESTGYDPGPAPAPPPAPAQPDYGASNQGITDPPAQAPSPAADPNAWVPDGRGSWMPPQSAWPSGMHWDPNMANYVPNPAAPAPAAQATARPTNGTLTDPGFAAQLVAWAGTQAGVNPSVRNDPNYWIGRFTSGAFGNDQNYAVQRMMTPEGPPEGSGGAPRPATTSAPRQVAAPQATQYAQAQSAPQGLWNSDFITQIRQMLMQRLAANSQPLDPNDPNITAPLTAARDEASRQSDKERTDLAEHLYASGGLNTDAISQKIQQSGEKNAAGLSGLRATLITRELTRREDELKSLLQMAVQSGDAESAAAIQMQLAELSAQVQREGMGLDAQKYAAYLNTIGAEQVMN